MGYYGVIGFGDIISIPLLFTIIYLSLLLLIGITILLISIKRKALKLVSIIGLSSSIVLFISYLTWYLFPIVLFINNFLIRPFSLPICYLSRFLFNLISSGPAFCDGNFISSSYFIYLSAFIVGSLFGLLFDLVKKKKQE